MGKLLIILLAIVGGYVGASVHAMGPQFGATTARTTITNPWIFSATTTTANITVTTTNSATSTIQVGCIQTTATSTATPIRLVIGSTVIGTTTYQGSTSQGAVVWQYGNCPRI